MPSMQDLEAVTEELTRTYKMKEAFADALRAVLLFHSASPWTPDKQLRWKQLTGLDPGNVTTKAMCDHIRSLVGPS